MPLFLQILRLPLVFISRIFTFIFGNFSWSRPAWLSYLIRLAKLSPLKLLSLLLLCAIASVSVYKIYEYYQSLPQPILIDAVITPPNVFYESENGEKTGRGPLLVEFVYNSSTMNATEAPQAIAETRLAPSHTTMRADFPSVAPIELVGEQVLKGITMHPAKAGIWTWQDDRTLSFIPETPWPAGQEYEVNFAPSVFETKESFSDDAYGFSTQALKGQIEYSEFSLSLDDNLKQVFFEISFNYPIDINSVERALTMAYQIDDNELGKSQEYSLSVSDDSTFISAIGTIDNLPEQPRIIEVEVDAGVKSLYGGEATNEKYASKIVVPDVYSYLKLEQSSIEVLRSPENEPEQFILLSFSDLISRGEILDKFSLYLLPNKQLEKDAQHTRVKHWQSPREINSSVLDEAQKVDFVLMPNAEANSLHYQMKIDVEPGRQLYFKVASGLRSANGFIQRTFVDKIVTVPPYPQEVIIAGEGSVLTHSTEHRLAFSTRGISDVKVTIGKVKDGQLYHLVSQTQGDISKPDFYNWRFNENNLAEFSSQFIKMNNNRGDLKTASYASVDLHKLINKEEAGLGLFFVEIKAWDTRYDREIYNVGDKLLVLITDLGLIVKRSQNNSQDIFVQSIATGQPVQNALVELVAKNGTTLFSKRSDERGHVSFPSAQGYTRENEPVVYIVKQQDDVSFIPYNRYTRQINYSRFDVGGEYTYSSENEGVNAYMFTDRGIYRPGETVNMGMIVKGKNLQNLNSIPLELVVRDPQYNEVYSEKITLSEFGFMEAKLNTQKSFKTGAYNASLHLISNNSRRTRDRLVGSLSFSVEEFQADTMSMTSKVVNLPRKGWFTGPTLINELKIQNLFGVPAQGRKVTSELTLSPMQFRFEDYNDVQFYSHQEQNDSHDGLKRIEQNLPELVSDADGQASLEIDLSNFRKGSYRLNIQSEGYEASGGRSVGVNTSILYSPSPYLLGYKSDGKLNFINMNSPRNLDIIAINNTLEAISLERLRLRLSQVQSISTLVQQYNGRYQYESIEKREVMEEGAFSLAADFNTVSLETSKAGNFVLEVLNENNEIVLSTNYTVVGASNDSGQLEKSAELKVVLDKADYQAGDTIELSIQAPYAGSGLISIESDKLHTFTWFKSTTKSSLQRISIPKNLEGNAYVNVAFVRNVASKEIFTSPLSYAVVPFSIDRSKRNLALEMQVEKIVQPGSPMTIDLNVSEDAKVAVFAVDVGILQVAKYRTPDPLAHFFKKRALNVQTMQILDLILPDFALTQMLSGAGGDMFADRAQAEMMMSQMSKARAHSQNPFERKVKDPAVFWSGVVDATKGNNTYTFNVPDDFAGALRVMAIAVGEQSMGRSEENTLVRGPFVISTNVLNQAAPSDEFDISVSVANVVENSPQNALVNVSLSSSPHLSIIGENSGQLRLNENQEDVLRFRVKANQLLGAAKITIKVNMTDAKGKTWQSAISESLSIRPAMPFEVNITTGVNNDGTLRVQTPLRLFQAQSQQMIKASTSPLVIAEGLSAYLAEYPHGCTEQIVSQVFPLVGLSSIPQYAPSNEKVAEYFSEVIDKLRRRQSYDGGFSYWSGIDNDLDTTIYVMHFLMEAQALNFAVPQDMLDSGLRYLQKSTQAYVGESRQNSTYSLLELRRRAKMIYLLTSSGVLTSNLLIDLVGVLDEQHENKWHKDLLSAYVGASYSLMQQSEKANALIKRYDLSEKTQQVDQAFAGLAPRTSLDAQYLLLLAKHFPEQLKELSKQAFLNITQSIYKGQYNTVSAAYSMLALGAYHQSINSAINKNAGDNQAHELLEAFDKQIRFSASNGQSKSPLDVSYGPFASALYPTDTEQIHVTMPTDILAKAGGLYYVNMQAGYQTKIPSEASNNGIEIQRAFINEDGKVSNSAAQGDELTVRLRVRATKQQNIANVAIVDLLPGGFEVIRESLNRRSGRWQSDYVDIREDRIVFYGNVDKQMREISYKVKVTAAGTFTIPASFAEAMYDRSVSGLSKAGSITVTKAD